MAVDSDKFYHPNENFVINTLTCFSAYHRINDDSSSLIEYSSHDIVVFECDSYQQSAISGYNYRQHLGHMHFEFSLVKRLSMY